MCGRFVRIIDITAAGLLFKASDSECTLGPSFNVAPKQPVAVVMEDRKRKIVAMQWGLIPHWSKDEKDGYKLINARAETIAEKPSYRNAFKSRRCLIIADGFFEWRQDEESKQPVYIYLENKNTFAMAGIFEKWVSPEGKSITTCSIITTAANEFMQPIHHRMPVILNEIDYDMWLDPDNHDLARLAGILQPWSGPMNCHDVSKEVNSPFHNGPGCIKPGR